MIMQELATTSDRKNLDNYGLKNVKAHWNLSPEELQRITGVSFHARKYSMK